MRGFAELVATTNYSFLRGASHPSDMVGEAMALGLRAIGIADRNMVAGVVRAYVALRDAPEKARVALMEDKAARVLSNDWSANDTKKLAASVLAQANKER